MHSDPEHHHSRSLHHRWIIRNISLTTRVLRHTSRIVGVRITSPITTKRNIKHYIMIREMRVNIAAASSHKVGLRQTPVCRIWSAGFDVCGNGAAREKPRRDSVGGPFCCVYATGVRVWTTIVGVEGGSIAIGSGGCDAAARVVVECFVALHCIDTSRHWSSAHHAVWAAWDVSLELGEGCKDSRVEAHLVLCLRVNAFDDIYLAATRPIGTKHPICFRQYSPWGLKGESHKLAKLHISSQACG